VTHPSGGSPPQTSSASRSIDTTRFASSSSTASTALCRGPPSGTTHPDLETSNGPRMPNSAHAISPATGSAAIRTPARPLLPSRPGKRLPTIAPPGRPPGPPLVQAAVQADPKAIPVASRCPVTADNRTGHPRASARKPKERPHASPTCASTPAPGKTRRPADAPDDHPAQRASGLPRHRHRPGTCRVGDPGATTGNFWSYGRPAPATPTGHHSARTPSPVGHLDDDRRNSSPVCRHDPHHTVTSPPAPGTPSTSACTRTPGQRGNRRCHTRAGSRTGRHTHRPPPSSQAGHAPGWHLLREPRALRSCQRPRSSAAAARVTIRYLAQRPSLGTFE
jgi:hypothetical protein